MSNIHAINLLCCKNRKYALIIQFLYSLITALTLFPRHLPTKEKSEELMTEKLFSFVVRAAGFISETSRQMSLQYTMKDFAPNV